MKENALSCAGMLFLGVVGWVFWLLGGGDLFRQSVASGHLLDWIMGGFCLVWLLLILKVPWDLYFQAHEVAFEIERSRERKVVVQAGRGEYIRVLRHRLLTLAVGCHLFSALLIAAITWFSRGTVGYYFAVFYLVSTVFRPAVAFYVYLTRKLRALKEEVRYPREDVLELREKVMWQETTLRDLSDQIRDCREALEREARVRGEETQELRQSVHALSREFETTVSRLTDNQEVIKGIQAFVRLIAQSTQA